MTDSTGDQPTRTQDGEHHPFDLTRFRTPPLEVEWVEVPAPSRSQLLDTALDLLDEFDRYASAGPGSGDYLRSPFAERVRAVLALAEKRHRD